MPQKPAIGRIRFKLEPANKFANTEHALKEMKDFKHKTTLNRRLPAAVFLPPMIRQQEFFVKYFEKGEAPDFKDNLMRVIQECDPIAQLIAMANGQPIASFNITTQGDVMCRAIPVPMDTRIEILKWLAREVFLRLPKKPNPVGRPKSDDGEGDGWSNLVEARATERKNQEGAGVLEK